MKTPKFANFCLIAFSRLSSTALKIPTHTSFSTNCVKMAMADCFRNVRNYICLFFKQTFCLCVKHFEEMIGVTVMPCLLRDWNSIRLAILPSASATYNDALIIKGFSSANKKGTPFSKCLFLSWVPKLIQSHTYPYQTTHSFRHASTFQQPGTPSWWESDFWAQSFQQRHLNSWSRLCQ